MIGFSGKGWIGVDIGTYSIKVAQVDRAGSNLRLVEGVIVPRRSALTLRKNQAETNTLPLLDETRAALALAPRLAGRKASCVLSMPFQDLRTLTLPTGSTQERRAMIASELAATWKAVDNREFDYWDGPANDAAPGSNDVYVLSILRELAQRASSDLRRAGLECQVIDGLPYTMARAINVLRLEEAHTPVAVIDWGYSSTTFCLAIDGRPQYCRTMRDCTLRHLLEPIGQGLNVTEDHQHHLLSHYGLPDTHGETDADRRAIQTSISELASAAFAEFRDQVEKTMHYLATHRPEIAPQRVWLTGGGATICNIGTFLDREFDFRIKVLGLDARKVRRVNHLGAADIPVALLCNAISLSALRWDEYETD